MIEQIKIAMKAQSLAKRIRKLTKELDDTIPDVRDGDECSCMEPEPHDYIHYGSFGSSVMSICLKCGGYNEVGDW